MSGEKKFFKVSPSRLKTWMGCRWQYYAKYTLRLPDPGNPKARLGSALHEVLELVAAPNKKDRNRYVLFTVKNNEIDPAILRLCNKVFSKYGVSDLHKDGIKLLTNAFLYSFDFKKVVAVEQRFTIPVSDNVAINGFIDKVQEVDDKTLELSDYKSGTPMSEKDCELDYQPFFYTLAALVLYPTKNTIFTFHFFKNKKSYTVIPKTKQELKDFLNFVIFQALEMQNFSKEKAVPTQSWKCKCCNFKAPNPDFNYEGCPRFSTFKQNI